MNDKLRKSHVYTMINILDTVIKCYQMLFLKQKGHDINHESH
jgi:hypothetical protein